MISSLLLYATIIATIGFAITWAISLRIKNYGLLDVTWSYSVALLAPFYAFLTPGCSPRKLLITTIGVAWSLRLGTYILLRVLRHHPQEDQRYESLRASWPSPFKFLLFFQLQALVAVIFSLPFLFTALNPNPTLSTLEIFALSLALLALIGESLADLQMQSFKRLPSSHLQVCQKGLWYYSRHPNYFFEALLWFAFALASLHSPYGWISLLCPLLMLYFLLKVTGIPLTEEHAVRSKGDAYRQYQRTTSPFIPWFKK